MNPQEILEETRKQIEAYAGDDPDKRFYVNRFVFARLQLDERKTKVEVKKRLMESSQPCHYCRKPFENSSGNHLHRMDGECGYSDDNCVLMHAECHIKYHQENPAPKRVKVKRGTPDEALPVLEKESKHYDDMAFLYWWDFARGFPEKMDRFEAVEFVKKDNHQRCHVPVAALEGFLTEDRQTSRGQGNWAVYSREFLITTVWSSP